MPLYMDIHHDIEADDDEIQAAHISDQHAQEKYGVRYLRYWFNPSRKTVCCLVEAPDAKAAEAVHAEAHGLLADKIIEVSEEVVEAFLGDSLETEEGIMITPSGKTDVGIRTVLFTDIVGSTDFTQQLGDIEAMKVLKIHDGFVRRGIDAHSGRVIKHTGDGFMATFSEVSSAINASISIQKAFEAYNLRNKDIPIHIRIGMSAGEPVDHKKDLFGATVQLARRVCDAGNGGEIISSNVVRELCLGKTFKFRELGSKKLKGFAEKNFCTKSSGRSNLLAQITIRHTHISLAAKRPVSNAPFDLL